MAFQFWGIWVIHQCFAAYSISLSPQSCRIRSNYDHLSYGTGMSCPSGVCHALMLGHVLVVLCSSIQPPHDLFSIYGGANNVVHEHIYTKTSLNCIGMFILKTLWCERNILKKLLYKNRVINMVNSWLAFPHVFGESNPKYLIQ